MFHCKGAGLPIKTWALAIKARYRLKKMLKLIFTFLMDVLRTSRIIYFSATLQRFGANQWSSAAVRKSRDEIASVQKCRHHILGHLFPCNNIIISVECARRHVLINCKSPVPFNLLSLMRFTALSGLISYCKLDNLFTCTYELMRHFCYAIIVTLKGLKRRG